MYQRNGGVMEHCMSVLMKNIELFLIFDRSIAENYKNISDKESFFEYFEMVK